MDGRDVDAFFLSTAVIFVAVATRSTEEPIGTWLGSTAGMVLADAIAMAIGSVLGARLPERPVKVGAAIAFVVFGAVLNRRGARSVLTCGGRPALKPFPKPMARIQ